MKNPFLIAFIVCIVVVNGCSSPIAPVNIPAMPTLTFTPIPFSSEITPSPHATFLEVNGEKVGIEFLQNGVSVPLGGSEAQWHVMLKPEPFALIVYGNKDLVSIMAIKSEDILLPLQQVTKPVVHPNGVGQGFYQNDLYLQDKPLEIAVGDFSFFTKAHFSEQDARETADFLKSQLGTEPFVMTSTSTYLGDYSNFTIETINGNVILNGDSITLVVFGDQKLAKGPQEFVEWFLAKWLVFKVEFLASQ